MITSVLMLLSACKNNQSDTASSQTASEQPDKLQVFFIDVGKGDAALIGLPGGHWVMIDTGPVEGFPEIGRTLIRQGVTHLDAIFISHGHKDHIGGLGSVLKMVNCDHIYTIPDCLDDEEIKDAKEDAKVEAVAWTAGQSVQIGDALFECVGPVKDYNDENENSMVLMLKFQDTCMLFTADQLSEAESDLLQSGKDLKADVLKVAYHGGAESTSAEFLSAIKPHIAVIPTDESRPAAQQTLDILSQAGAQAYVLGDTGTLVYDGKSISKIFVPEDNVPDVSVNEKDVTEEFITIKNNTNETVDLTGWCLYSKNGADTYFYPEGTELPPHGSLTVYSGKAAQDSKDGLVWTTKEIWSN